MRSSAITQSEGVGPPAWGDRAGGLGAVATSGFSPAAKLREWGIAIEHHDEVVGSSFTMEEVRERHARPEHRPPAGQLATGVLPSTRRCCRRHRRLATNGGSASGGIARRSMQLSHR